MAVNFQTYRDVYSECDSKGRFVVFDKREKLEDFDGTLLELCKGSYRMINTETPSAKALSSDCLIQKFSPNHGKLRSFKLLKNIRHPSVVSVQNFYDEMGEPRFVLSWVDGSIMAWTKKSGAGKILKTSMNGTCPSSTFRRMLVDICSGLEHLFKHGVYPIKIGVNDIFMQTIGTRSYARLLISDAKQLAPAAKAKHEEKLWSEVKVAALKIFNEAEKTQNTQMTDPIASRFFKYIGNGKGSGKLDGYPFAWTAEQKAKYLLWIVSMGKAVVSKSLQGSGITWPGTSKSGNLPAPLQQMIDHDKARANPSKYKISDPFDYLRICKDIIKHWLVLPKPVQQGCTSWDMLVERMEKWNPMIWCKLYERFE
ncbi:unnamed protein product [Urochloa decumbens]|uniref:Uncharacterized protein n=1 Tax=Urochloa decumbens TaxID=240449 RepID=A0ABC8WTM8_9POAL